MRIGLDCHAIARDWAGMHNYTLGLARGLLALAEPHDWTLFGVADAGVLPPGARARTVPPVGAIRYRLLKMGWLSVERYVGPVDVFHTPTFSPLRQRGGRSVVTVADVTPLIHPEWHTRRRARQFERFIPRRLRRADRIIAISESTKRDLVRLYGLPQERIDVTLLAASPRFRPVAEPEAREVLARHGLSYRGYMLFTGTIEPRKNVARLVEAAGTVRGLPLVIAGRPGWKSEPVTERIEKAGVRTLGFVDAAELPAIVGSAALFVYPSLYEGFGLPPLEAMQCGVPVVTSNVSSLPEVVGDAALTVDPANTGQLAGAMQRVLADEALRVRLSEAGLRRAARFSWEQTARATLEVYVKARAAL